MAGLVDMALWVALWGVGVLIVALGAIYLWRQLFGDARRPPPRRRR